MSEIEKPASCYDCPVFIKKELRCKIQSRGKCASDYQVQVQWRECPLAWKKK